MNAITPPAAAPVESMSVAVSLLNCVAQAMGDPATDVGKLELLIRLQREIIADDARLQYARAMRAAQADMMPILRTAQNTSTNSRYAPLEVIDAVIRPIYTRHGFAMEFNSEPVDGGVRLICEVTHTPGGHTKTRHLEAALDAVGPQGRANKTPVQALVSSTTYLRRTLTCMVWNLALTNEDMDGNAPRNDGRLTERQVEELWELMRRTETQEARFLTVMCPAADLRSIGDVPAVEFPRLRNALLTKANVRAQRAAAARAATSRQPINGDARP